MSDAVSSETRSIKIVGAGFTGLVTAYFLIKKGFQVELFESANRVGGLIQSDQVPEGLVETAANGVLNTALFESLAQDVGVELQGTRPESRRRFILRDGRPRRWPLTFFETLGFLFRFVLAGLFGRRRAPLAKETILVWGRRVLGQAAVERLVAPALLGIYAGDASRMSASLVLGRFFAPRPALPKPRIRGTVCPKEGMGSLLKALESWLRDRGVRFHFEQSMRFEDLKGTPNPLVVCVSASQAAQFFASSEPTLSELLSRIEMRPLVTSTLFYGAEAGRLKGFGCLFPHDSGYESLGVLFSSFIFLNRAQEGLHAETWIRLLQPSDTDAHLLNRIAQERERLLGFRDEPRSYRLTRWPQALPHYTIELEELLPQIERETARLGVHLCGNYLGSIGLARILERSQDLVESLIPSKK